MRWGPSAVRPLGPTTSSSSAVFKRTSLVFHRFLRLVGIWLQVHALDFLRHMECRRSPTWCWASLWCPWPSVGCSPPRCCGWRRRLRRRWRTPATTPWCSRYVCRCVSAPRLHGHGMEVAFWKGFSQLTCFFQSQKIMQPSVRGGYPCLKAPRSCVRPPACC